jgi:hypothetical protein
VFSVKLRAASWHNCVHSLAKLAPISDPNIQWPMAQWEVDVRKYHLAAQGGQVP